jgi:hypothetical protein
MGVAVPSPLAGEGSPVRGYLVAVKFEHVKDRVDLCKVLSLLVTWRLG